MSDQLSLFRSLAMVFSRDGVDDGLKLVNRS